MDPASAPRPKMDSSASCSSRSLRSCPPSTTRLVSSREPSLRADEVRSHIRWAIALLALGVILLWVAFLARHALLLIYVSGLLAVGFSPIVRVIERQTLLPIGSKTFPTWLALPIPVPLFLGG